MRAKVATLGRVIEWGGGKKKTMTNKVCDSLVRRASREAGERRGGEGGKGLGAPKARYDPEFPGNPMTQEKGKEGVRVMGAEGAMTRNFRATRDSGEKRWRAGREGERV